MPSPSSCRSCWVSIFCEIPAIARSRSEKRSVLPPKRWKRMTSFHRPSSFRMACSIPAAADAARVCALTHGCVPHFRVRSCGVITCQVCSPRMSTHANAPIHLPPPIAAYFAADTSDADAVARCFSERAVVIDERREHRGRPAITRWKAEATAKDHYTSEPLAADASGAGGDRDRAGHRRLPRQSRGPALPLHARRAPPSPRLEITA